MEKLLTIARFFDWPARRFGYLAGWIMIPLITVIMFDVITRKNDYIRIAMADANLRWFNPIIFQDLEWHLHAVIMFFSFGFAYLLNTHVRVDIFREMLSLRKQAWMEMIGLAVFAIPYLVLISYFAWRFVSLSVGQNEGSESLTGIGMRYIIKSFMLIGFLLLWCSFIATILRLISFLFGEAGVQQEAEAELSIFTESDALNEYREQLEQAAQAELAKERSS